MTAPAVYMFKDLDEIKQVLHNNGSLVAVKYQHYAHLRSEDNKLVAIVQRSTLDKLVREFILKKTKVPNTHTPCWVLV